MNKRNFAELKEKEFDLIVIGGGITGAWIALDASRRGLSTVLLDKDDFGAATSAKSSKLLHGGIRYLQQLQFSKVRESAIERSWYQSVAPHLCHFIPFLVPCYRDIRKSKLLLRIGMMLYRVLCYGENSRIKDFHKKIPKGWFISKKKLVSLVDLAESDSLTGGSVFYESHMENSERMTLAIIKSAVDSGAFAYNYTRVERFINDDNKIKGVSVADRIDGDEFKIRGRMIINTTGPWIDGLNRTLFNSDPHDITTGFSKGSHIVTRQIIKDYAVALPSQHKGQSIVDRGGRHVFVIPWRGHSLMGTTNEPLDNGLDNLSITNKEIENLIFEVNSSIPSAKLDRNDVLYSFSGIYPLQANTIKTDTYQGTGEYLIIDHESHSEIKGLITALGAKFTTSRLVAEKTVDLVTAKLDLAVSCKTKGIPLTSGTITDIESFKDRKCVEFNHLFPVDLTQSLIRRYGKDIDSIYSLGKSEPQLLRTVSERDNIIEAEIVYIVKNEAVCHLSDLIFRRTGLGTIGNPGAQCLSQCVKIMGDLLNWDDKTRHNELESVMNHLNTAVSPNN